MYTQIIVKIKHRHVMHYGSRTKQNYKTKFMLNFVKQKHRYKSLNQYLKYEVKHKLL